MSKEGPHAIGPETCQRCALPAVWLGYSDDPLCPVYGCNRHIGELLATDQISTVYPFRSSAPNHGPLALMDLDSAQPLALLCTAVGRGYGEPEGDDGFIEVYVTDGCSLYAVRLNAIDVGAKLAELERLLPKGD